MEDNKYYTPTIEEFYIGFECEYQGLLDSTQVDYEFYPFVYNLGNISLDDIDYAINKNWIRVKYLDNEDIESLGWNCETTGYYTLTTKYQNLTLRHMEGNVYSWVGIYSKHDLSGTNVLFDGSIKNKSELKKIMKQLILKYK